MAQCVFFRHIEILSSICVWGQLKNRRKELEICIIENFVVVFTKNQYFQIQQ